MAADECRNKAPIAVLRVRAQEVRVQSQAVRRQVRATRQKVIANRAQLRATLARAEQLRTMWPPPTGWDMAQLAVPVQRPSKLQSLPMIEQAKGVIMAQNGLTADQAFDWLCRASKQENIKVRELAARITASAARHESSPCYPAPGQHEPPVDAEVVVLAAHRRRPQQD